jgi:hypothetical protein
VDLLVQLINFVMIMDEINLENMLRKPRLQEDQRPVQVDGLSSTDATDIPLHID